MSSIKKILIAEDEKPMARALGLKLEHNGFEVTNAYNGQEALDAMAEEKFDLLLLDLMMPKVGGFEVLEEIKKKKIDIKVIVTSNLSQPEDSEKARSLGAIDYFVKSNMP